MAGSRRLNKELSELVSNPDPQIISIDPEESNFYRWHVVLQGAEDFLYVYKFNHELLLEFSKDYPFKGPVAHFESKVYHPNVDEHGGLLKPEAWKPSTKTASILDAIFQLLAEPNPDDALVPAIAKQYTTDIDQFNATAREYTQQYSK
ncbi:signal peptidase I [Malassezia psittaci]|uniref:Signal peptidase I n=1 Tax=Malassezia psittaci TaxID=1821823 RepID=A0AAF0FIQ1_9BASI|nr:signal peptidase I [Malassezia psittaci]